MLRLFINNLKQKLLKNYQTPTSTKSIASNFFNTFQYCCKCDKTEFVIGGGLEKPQGGLQEEKYFYKQNCDLMAKINKSGATLKCENNVSDWDQFEKVLSARETCSLNKHKNCLEEVFFLNQQHECCAKLNKNDFTSAKKTIKGSEEIEEKYHRESNEV